MKTDRETFTKIYIETYKFRVKSYCLNFCYMAKNAKINFQQDITNMYSADIIYCVNLVISSKCYAFLFQYLPTTNRY